MAIDKNEVFRQATIRICGSLDIETALWRLLQYLEKIMPLTGMNLHVFGDRLTTFRTIAEVTLYEVEKLDKVVKLPEDAVVKLKSMWAELDSQDVMIVNRPELNPFMKTVTTIVNKPDTSIMFMRVGAEDKKLGAVVLYVDGRGKYEKEHAELLSVLHDPFSIAMTNALRHEELNKLKDKLAEDIKYLHQELRHITDDTIIGEDYGLKEVKKMVLQVSSLNSPVLLLGETGVGKEVIANAIHYSSPRKEGPFIKVNCGAIPEPLLDSELFGHEKGAFTGATGQKRGRFERAHKGTILLDEIGELPPQAQIRLLRVLQNKEIERLGGTTPIQINARIIAATHRDLKNMVQSGLFREDLWYRLNVFPIYIPPLRQRKEDIPLLVRHFIEKKSAELNYQTHPYITPETMEKLKSYHWPGNVRELENLIERALIKSRGQDLNGPLTLDSFDLPEKKEDQAFLSDITKGFPTLDDLNAMYIEQILVLTKGRVEGQGGAAERLGVHPSTLRGRMRKLGISYKKNI